MEAITLGIFRNPGQAQANIDRLTSDPFGASVFENLLPKIIEILTSTPNPDQALNHLERLSRAVINQSSFFHFLEDYPQFLDLLLTIFGHSNYLADILNRHSEYFYWLVTAGINQSEFDREAFLTEFKNSEKQLSSIEKKINLLKRLKRREILRIGTLDIMGWIDLPTTTRNLSDLADTLIESVFYLHRREAEAIFGKVPAKLAVIGLGKLGGIELNYSSDIDIIFVYSQEGEGRRLDTRHTFSYHDYFNRLAEKIVHSLSLVSDGEALYRVDTRLRPDGVSGPLARSLTSYLHYYELRGRIWERQMLIKARPVAENLDFGKHFLKQLEPFIYPKTFLTSPLESIKEIKKSIEQRLSLKETDQTDIKLKSGGIRDIEFAVQALQLVNGGIVPEIREQNTLFAIEKLEQKKLLSKSESAELKEAYLFFRKIEHHLQLEDWRQTHLLPEDAHKRLVLSRKMGFKTAKDFKASIRRTSKQVRLIYQSVLAEEIVSETNTPDALLSAQSLTPELRQTLLESGFQNPAQVFKLFHGLSSGDVQRPFSSLSKKSFRAIFPALLEELKKQPTRNEALVPFAAFVKAYGSPQSLYALFRENTNVLKLTLQICGEAPLLAKLLTTHPEFFSVLTTPEALYESFQIEHFAENFSQNRATFPESDWLQQLRVQKSAALFQIGVQFLAKFISLEELFLSLSDLAQATLEIALSQILGESNIRTAFPAAIIGLGKLGSRELNFGSDLDVLFLTTQTETPSLQEQETILTDLISRLSQISPTGQLYKIDARLRPEGAGAPLLISLATYRNYLQNRAELWERQMLLRSRPVAGNDEIWKAFSTFLEDYIFAPGLSETQIDKIFSMLEKIHQKSRKKFSQELDLKNSPGGIVDIEFLIQLFQIKYGKEFPPLRRGTIPQLFENLVELKIVPEEKGQFLRETYLFYRRIETVLQLGLERSRAKIPLQGEKLEFLASLLQFKNGAIFLSELKSRFKHTSELLKSFKTILKAL